LFIYGNVAKNKKSTCIPFLFEFSEIGRYLLYKEIMIYTLNKMSKQLQQIYEDYTITRQGRIYDKEGVEVDTFINSCGYVSALLNGRIVTVAYMVAKQYVNNPNKCICIAYKDGDFTNINADNLYWYYEGDECEKYKGGGLQLYIIDYDTYKIIDTLNSITEAADKLGLNYSSISHIILGKINQPKKYYIIPTNEYNEYTIKAKVEETKDKWKRTNKRSKKGVMQFDYNGNLIKEYESFKEAAIQLGICPTFVSKICNAETKQRKDYYLISQENYDENTIKDLIREANR